MKTYKTAITVAATIVASLAASFHTPAQTNTNLFPAVYKAVCVSTGANGAFVYRTHTSSNLLQECATENNLTNLASLALVYNRSNSSLDVINTSNRTVVCTALSFEGGLSITNTNNTRVERLAFVFVETNTFSSGLLSARERLTWTGTTTNLLLSFSLVGKLDYYLPASGTNPPAICRGILLVGAALSRDHDDDDDDDDDDDNGNGPGSNNGNHYGWDNGNAPWKKGNPPSGNGINGNNNNGNNGNNNGFPGNPGQSRGNRGR